MAESDVQEYYRPWSLIRSEPDVFTNMIKRYGITDVVAEDVLTLDTLTDLSKDNTFGIILAYKYSEDPLPENISTEYPDAEKITFTAQLITNSCATIGLLNVLSNVDIERGDIIQNFLDFTKDFDSVDRGLALGSCPEIRDIHNSYYFDDSSSDADDEQEEKGKEDVHGVERTASESAPTGSDNENNKVFNAYHFVGYIFKNDYIWELDGLKRCPIKLQHVNRRANWLKLLKPILAAKIESSQLTANILSIVKDPVYLKEEQLQNLLDQSNKLTEDLFNEEQKLPGTSSSTKSRRSINKLNKKKVDLDSQITQLENEINLDKSDTAAKMTNVGRVFNEYFSFISETARVALSRGLNLQDFCHTSEYLRESMGQETSSVQKKSEDTSKKDKGKGRAIEFASTSITSLSFPTIPGLSSASTAVSFENKNDRIRLSVTEKFQKGRGRSKTSTIGMNQRVTGRYRGRGRGRGGRNVEYTASTSKNTQKETIEVARTIIDKTEKKKEKSMQARKRKLEDGNEADDESDFPSVKKK